MTTGIAFSEKYLEHDLGPTHPERPQRLKAIMDSLKGNSSLFKGIQLVEPSPATVGDIELVHDPSHVKKIRELSETGRMVDLDTPVKSNTYDLALLSAGGTIRLGQNIVSGEVENGFALVRPPGHHATRKEAGGFCYFNNIAIASRKLLKETDVDRVLIFDFDAHHGNGTQDIFYTDDDVLYMSFHQNGNTLYPGSGFPEEVGEGGGQGFTVNVPFPPGSDDGNYAAALGEFLIPLSESFDPDLIMVSAGFDPHAQDPLTQLKLSADAFEWMAKAAVNQAEKLCGGRISFVLEGGYSISASSEAAMKVLEALVYRESLELPEGERLPIFDKVKEALSSYWDF